MTYILLDSQGGGIKPRALHDDSIRHTLRSLAKRWLAPDNESRELAALIESLVTTAAPQLIEPFGIGVDTAAEILIVVGDNPERIKSEAALAKLAGISPIPASSGMTTGKHRINHGGHRQLNAAIYRTVIVRMRFHEPTIAYVNPAHRRGKKQTRHHPMPQAIRHPRGLPPDQSATQRPKYCCLTTIGASTQ